ncbi:hypothetical protein ABGM11_004373, partial [Shigella sonnei]
MKSNRQARHILGL